MNSPINVIQGGSVFFSGASAFSKWFVIGDANRFYLIMTAPGRAAGTLYSATHFAYFFGDADSGLPGDPGRFVVAPSSGNTSNRESYSSLSYSNQSAIQSSSLGATSGGMSYAAWLSGPATGGFAPLLATVTTPFGGFDANQASYTVDPSQANGWAPLSPIYICASRNQGAAGDWIANPVFRLMFPGLVCLPCAVLSAAGNVVDLFGVEGVGLSPNASVGISRIVRTDEW